jgi:hypothetical protein
LRRDFIVNHANEGKTEGKEEEKEEDVSSFWMTLGKETILECERGSTRSPSLENSLCKGLWTCRKTDYANE